MLIPHKNPGVASVSPSILHPPRLTTYVDTICTRTPHPHHPPHHQTVLVPKDTLAVSHALTYISLSRSPGDGSGSEYVGGEEGGNTVQEVSGTIAMIGCGCLLWSLI